MNTGNCPAAWAESIITPVFKKGAKDDPNNYRAISVGNSISKVFMKIFAQRLANWAESQAGFRSIPRQTISLIYSLLFKSI